MYISPYQRIVNLVTAPIQPMYFWGAIASAVGSKVVGGLFSKKASGQSSGGSQQAAGLSAKQFKEAKKAFQPYLSAGTKGLADYQDILGRQQEYEDKIQSDVRDPFKFGAAEFDQYKDAGYDFRLGEGERALNRGFGALGKRFSGERAAGLMDYGQRMGSQEFSAARGRAAADYESGVSREQQQYQRSLKQYGRQYEDQLQSFGQLADAGRDATGTLYKLGAGAAQEQSKYAQKAGEAAAAGTLGIGGAVSKGLGDLGNIFNSNSGGGGGDLNTISYDDATSGYDTSDWGSDWGGGGTDWGWGQLSMLVNVSQHVCIGENE